MGIEAIPCDILGWENHHSLQWPGRIGPICIPIQRHRSIVAILLDPGSGREPHLLIYKCGSPISIGRVFGAGAALPAVIPYSGRSKEITAVPCPVISWGEFVRKPDSADDCTVDVLASVAIPARVGVTDITLIVSQSEWDPQILERKGSSNTREKRKLCSPFSSKRLDSAQ